MDKSPPQGNLERLKTVINTNNYINDLINKKTKI